MNRNKYVAPEAEVIAFMSKEALMAEEISVTEPTFKGDGPSWD